MTDSRIETGKLQKSQETGLSGIYIGGNKLSIPDRIMDNAEETAWK